MTAPARDLLARGWAVLPPDPAMAEWVAAARPVADRLLADPALRARWMRCGGTWFAGVNVFPNDASGAVPAEGVPPLAGPVLDVIAGVLGLGGFAWDPAQISVCLPGYPAAASEGESEAAFAYRRKRDAAHVDGLARDAARRRRLGELHGFILGIPLAATPPGASPLVVWEGSHEIVRAALRARLAPVAPCDWLREDITDAYVSARTRIFESCRRVAVHASPGGCYLIHRLALHGVAPWGEDGGEALRRIAYFRPDPFPGASPEWWLERP